VTSVLGRSVALKVIGPVNGLGAFTEQLRHEAHAVALLDHPNIVRLYDFDEDNGRIYLACEYVEGDTLRAGRERDALRSTRSCGARERSLLDLRTRTLRASFIAI